jgi:hypothetical protein
VGFFSTRCRACGHSILSHHAVSPSDERAFGWMKNAVAITREGDIHTGEYDGYGRIGDWDSQGTIGRAQSVYHRACWEVIGKPTSFSGPSFDARDQGYFFDAADHDLPDPRTHELVACLLVRAPSRAEEPIRRPGEKARPPPAPRKKTSVR